MRKFNLSMVRSLSLCHMHCDSSRAITTRFLKPTSTVTRLPLSTHLLGASEDVRVTSIEDGHGGTAEKLTAGGTELDLHSIIRH